MQMLYKYRNGKPVPELLINEAIENGDIDKKFWVINGAWGGTFNGGSIVIHHPIYGDSMPNTMYKCYKFKSKPPEEYYELYESYYPKDFNRDIPYEPWFQLFRDLVEKGEIV